jgi:hypothetical protein
MRVTVEESGNARYTICSFCEWKKTEMKSTVNEKDKQKAITDAQITNSMNYCGKEENYTVKVCQWHSTKSASS